MVFGSCFIPKRRRVGPSACETEEKVYSEVEMQEQHKECAIVVRNLKIEIERLTKLAEEAAKQGESKASLTRRPEELSLEMKNSKIESTVDDMNNRIRAEIDHFFDLKDNIVKIFHQYADVSVSADSSTISEARLDEALAAFGIRLSKEEITLTFKSADIDISGGLSLEEFRRVAGTSTKLQEWASMLPLAALLGRCLSFKGGNEPLQEIADFTARERQAVVQEFSWGCGRLLEKALDELKELSRTQHRAQSEGSSKFQTTLKMSTGNIDNFHEGLACRVGAPHPEMDKGIREEHCEKAECDVVFETSNYGVRTTPRKEYEITVEGKECPDAERKDKSGTEVRVVRRIETLMELKMVRIAGLSTCEIAAVVLYTGPMFQIYNTILRRYPDQEFQRFAGGDNLFSTTIHVLVSAVMKVSRTQTLPSGLKLYRGLGGMMDLPDGFYCADERGCRGCMEWGFLSTTSDKHAAMEYCGLKEGRPLPMLLRLTTGSVDRPACIYDLSQYPGEREYLFVPCSFLEPLLCAGRAMELVRNSDGVVVGAVGVVTVRVNANLKGHTVEELEGRKKALHLDAFRYGIHESARRLKHLAAEGNLEERISKDPRRLMNQNQWVQIGGRLESLMPGMSDGEMIKFTGEGLQAYLVREARAVLARHAALPNQTYASTAAYRGLADEALKTLQSCTAGLPRYLECPTALVEVAMRTKLSDGFRAYHARLWRLVLAAGEGTATRAEAAGRLCVSTGLIEASAEEADVEGLTPLMRAAAEGAGPRALRCLVWAGAQVNRQDPVRRRSALFIAAQYGHPHAVEELARLGADVNLTGLPGYEGTPAWNAAQEGYIDVIEALGRLGADLNRPDLNGRTPVYVAADMGHLEVVRALHRFKADVNTPHNNGTTPLAAAVAKGRVEAAEALMGMGAR